MFDVTWGLRIKNKREKTKENGVCRDEIASL